MNPYFLAAFILWALLTIHHLLVFRSSLNRYYQGKTPLPIVISLGLVWLFHITIPFLLFQGST